MSGSGAALASVIANVPLGVVPPGVPVGAGPSNVRTDYGLAVKQLSPVAYWRLNEASGNVADSSGNGYTGTASGTITYRVAGAIARDADTAVTLDGTTGFFSTGVAPALNFAFAAPFSLVAWVAPALDSANRTVMGNLNIGGNTAGYGMRLTTSNTLRLILANDNANFVFSDTTALKAAPAYHFVVATWDGATPRTYVDSVLDSAVTTGGTGASNLGSGQTFNIGRDLSGGSFWKTSLDEVAVFASLLTQAQITRLWLAGIGR